MKKTTASSLNYTILLFVLITSIVSTIIYINYYIKLQQLGRLQKLEAINNCQSGLNYLLATRNHPDIDRFDSVLQLNVGQDSIIVSSFCWGGYSILHSAVRKKNFSIERLAMSGNYRIGNNSPTVILKDNNLPLCLCLKTMISGKILTPKAKIKYELMNGQPFTGSYIEKELIHESKDSLPILNGFFKQLRIKSLVDYFFFSSNSRTESQDYLQKDTISRSFNKSTIVVYDKTLLLDDMIAEGNVVFISDSLVVITKNCNLNGVIVIGKEIIIEEGFKGSIQCFAKNKIFVSKNVKLEFPSGLFLIPEKLQIDSASQTQSIKSIMINEEAEISGIVFSNYLLDAPHSFEVRLEVEKNSKVNGLVFWTGSIQLKGIISGQLFADSFYIKNAFGYYDNYISNGAISIDSVCNKMVFPSLFPIKKNSEIVKWLR